MIKLTFFEKLEKVSNLSQKAYITVTIKIKLMFKNLLEFPTHFLILSIENS